MEAKTLKALSGSIKKWEKIVAGTGKDRASENCPLCQAFDGKCEQCPVMKKTGKDLCDRSPFEEWAGHQFDIHGKMCGDDCGVLCPTCRRLARAELKFLKSLLPKAVKP